MSTKADRRLYWTSNSVRREKRGLVGIQGIVSNRFGAIMFKTLALMAVLFGTVAAFDHVHLATCTGADPCRVCKNCKYCGYCKSGKTCGVCKPTTRPATRPTRGK
jgi:hypothetical protein